MRTAAVAAILAVIGAAAALPSAASGALPQQGVLVAGKSLGGVRLGMTPAQVRGVWGRRFGICRGCRERTWYFNYRRFTPSGAAVSFAEGRVNAVWTLWSPRGWQTHNRALRLGVPEAQVNGVLGTLVTLQCGSYRALVRTRGEVTTVYYIFGGKLWGFGLLRPGATPCR